MALFADKVLRVGWGSTLVAQQYTERFRAYRKALHAEIGTKSEVSRFDALQGIEVGRFLFHVLNEPASVLHHIRRYA